VEENKTKSVAARLTMKEIAELRRIAKQKDRTVSYLITQMVRASWGLLNTTEQDAA
jgi:hypothetical protein